MIRKNKKFIDPRYFMDEKTERLDEFFGFGNKAKRRKELEAFIKKYKVKEFLVELMRALKSLDPQVAELEDLLDLTSQDQSTTRPQLRTVIRQGGVLEAFADSLPQDYDEAVLLIQNIVQEDPKMFNALMQDAASQVGPMASPEQSLGRSHS